MSTSQTHLTKADLQTDAVTQELKKGFQWTQAHAKGTLLALFIFIGVGIAYSGYKYFSEQRASSSQEAYYKIEKEYLTKLAQEKKATPQAKSEITLDYDKDLAEIVKKFNTVIDSDPSSNAAIMAALNISEIASKYQKDNVAFESINKVKIGTNLLSMLLLNEKATILENKNDCKSAIELWSKVISNAQAAPIKSQALLKQALCYETINENSKAEENYNKIIAESKDGALGKIAEKYLRLLKTKLN